VAGQHILYPLNGSPKNQKHLNESSSFAVRVVYILVIVFVSHRLCVNSLIVAFPVLFAFRRAVGLKLTVNVIYSVARKLARFFFVCVITSSNTDQF